MSRQDMCVCVCGGVPLASNLSVSSHLAQKIATITSSVVDDDEGRNRRKGKYGAPTCPRVPSTDSLYNDRHDRQSK